MTFRRPKSPAGITLLEVMAAIVIVLVAVLGASGYRYYSTLDAKRAEMHSTAARVALLLCENWRGRGFDRTATFDPVPHLGSELKMSVASVGPKYPEGFTPLERYEMFVDGVQYWAVLSWNDEAADLRALNVIVAWSQRQTGLSNSITFVQDKTFRLTTYVSQ